MELPLIVQFVMVVGPPLAMPPPSKLAELPEIVLPVTVSVAPLGLLMPPPLKQQPGPATLLLTVHPLSVKPPWLEMPPPPEALPKPLVMVKPEMVTIEAK